MIPLSIFLAIWGILVIGFGILALITQAMSLRFSISGSITIVSNIAFISVALLVLAGTGLYILSVDWTQTVSLIPTTLPIGIIK